LGGDAPGGLAFSLAALADRLDLDRAESDRIARASVWVARDGLVLDLLERLIRNGRAGVPALVESALEALDDPALRGGVLLLLARTRGAPPEQATLAEAVPRIGAEAPGRALLLELVARGAPAHLVVSGARGALTSPPARHDVLLALARRPAHTPATLSLVADAVPWVGQEALEAEVLAALAAWPGSAPVVLAAAERALETPPARGRVLLALAGRAEQFPGELAAVAARVDWIGREDEEARALVALVRAGAPTSQVLASWRRALSVPESRAAVLRALTAAQTLPRGELDLVARAVPEIGQEALEEQALVELAQDGTASAGAVLGAVQVGLRAPRGRSRVLQALADRPTLPRDEADLVAAAAPRLLEGEPAAAVLLRLIPKASPGAIEAAAGSLRGPGDRARVLAALERARGP
jgi:hypothetical protein